MKWLILMFLLALPTVKGYNLENDNYKMNIGIVSGGNLSNTNYDLDINIYPIQSNLSGNNYKLDLGYLINWIIVPSVTPPAGGGGGGAPKKVITLYYDLILDNIKSTYNLKETINPRIIIINKGDTPDRDAILTYYLLSPEDERVGEARAVFEEVPPLFYNETECNKFKFAIIDEETGNCVTLIDREISFPTDATFGGWSFNAEYETETQPLIEVHISFILIKGFDIPFTAIIGLLGLIYFIRKNKKKEEVYIR